MADTETTVEPPPLIREGSNVFAAIAVAAVLVGGLAGIARADGDASQSTVHPSDLASTTAHHGDDDAAGLDDPADHAHTGITTAGDGASGTGHAHGDVAGGTANAAADDHHSAAAAAQTASDGSARGDDAAHGEHVSGATGHGAHDDGGGGEAAGAGDHDHAASCSDDHPDTISLVREVQGELGTSYKDVAALVALGYHPYFDSLVPGGYPPGGEGISHWINPNYIDDAFVLDPQRPETIILDGWYWPIGMMFINDPDVPPEPVYVNADGTACSPWHPHTDAPARFGWYYYRAVYDRELEGEVPAQTPEMMHVWAVPNPAGVYAAHDYPPREVRNGPPGPLPSYFSEATIPGSSDAST